MRYPTGLSEEDFKKNWYIAQGFGVGTSYGFHEGPDINLKTGGNTDLGQPLYAVGDGKIVYYHSASHPTNGFGLHMVLEVETKLGKRWFHYCHCQTITNSLKRVKEGEVIGTLGKSGGQQFAHLHFSCFKIDPAKLSKGIDSIAKSVIDLNKYWEDPLALIDKLNQEADNGGMNFIDLKKRLNDTNWSELNEFSSLEKLGLIERADSIQTMTMKWLKSNSDMSINQAKTLDLLSKRDQTIIDLNEQITGLKTNVEDLKRVSTAEVQELLRLHKKITDELEEIVLDKKKEILDLQKSQTPIIQIDFSKLISFLKEWKWLKK